MDGDKDSDLLRLLQPDLFTTDELITVIKSRCPKVQNLSSMTKERLVGLFRQVILPLPQRCYRTNRRGRLLMARRVKSGLDSSARRATEETRMRSTEKAGEKRLAPSDRLKPCPDSSTPNKIRISSSLPTHEQLSNHEDSTTKVVLKRSSSSSEKSERCSVQSSPQKPVKKQRTAIKWP